MDRPRQPRPRFRAFVAAGVLGLGLLGVVAAGFGQGEADAPRIPERSIRTSVAQRGELIRSVRGPGTLVAEDTQWLTATTAARVHTIVVEAGSPVTADTVVLELRNPDLELAALEAQSELAAARAELANLEAGLETDRLGQEASLVQIRSEHAEATRIAAANETLARQGSLSQDERVQAQERAQELDARLGIERKRLRVLGRARKAQVAAQRARVGQLEAVVEFRQAQLQELSVTAGVAGVLQEVPVQLGQWVQPGTVLAKVVQPDRLEAQLRIPEVRAKDIRLGQKATIDLRNAAVSGEVSRIDPAVTDGNVIVDIALQGSLPDGARPDLSIDGVIELERLDDVLWIQRPLQAEPNQRLGLFVLDEHDSARRIRVELGRASIDAIEVRTGLKPGDEVIVSDMTPWHGHDLIRIERGD